MAYFVCGSIYIFCISTLRILAPILFVSFINYSFIKELINYLFYKLSFKVNYVKTYLIADFVTNST